MSESILETIGAASSRSRPGYLASGAAAVLLIAGLAKLAAPVPSMQHLEQSLPAFVRGHEFRAVHALASLELVTGLSLLVTGLRRSAGVSTAALCVGFSIWIFRDALLGRTEACGCFGDYEWAGSYPARIAMAALLSCAAFERLSGGEA